MRLLCSSTESNRVSGAHYHSLIVTWLVAAFLFPKFVFDICIYNLFFSMENWSKRDLQVAVLQTLACAVALHFSIVYLLPYLHSMLQQFNHHRTSNVLSEVQDKKSSRENSIGSLEEEAVRLRNDLVERHKTVASKPRQQEIFIEDRFKINVESLDASVPNTQSELVEHNGDVKRNQTVVRSGQGSNSAKFRLSDHIHSSEKETNDAALKKQEPVRTSKTKGQVTRTRPPSSSSSSRSASTSHYSTPTYNFQQDHNNEEERQATLSEQDLAYEVALRSDRTRKLLQEERTAEFERLVAEYTSVVEEPGANDPEAITIVFKISDDVYAKRTNMAVTVVASELKHKKISRRFSPTDTVHSLFSFIFCHIYQFPGLEERYMGNLVPVLFSPCLSTKESEAIQESADFISFDLICSYPRLVLRSSTLFFKDVLHGDNDPLQTILDLGIKNNTLLSLRPSD